ncbi:hypothetical protein [Bacillus sp. SA1-12]|uniref:hypothetical protein n=1 Tax=Bacillus sp. SA1-12 TaxID=1455638 RepID=UPI000A435CBF|nr:hypothetical protein [Bacillus sp. SA1-12]
MKLLNNEKAAPELPLIEYVIVEQILFLSAETIDQMFVYQGWLYRKEQKDNLYIRSG